MARSAAAVAWSVRRLRETSSTPLRANCCGQLSVKFESESKTRLYVMHLSLSSPSIQSQLLGILNRFDTSPGLLGDDGASRGYSGSTVVRPASAATTTLRRSSPRCQSRLPAPPARTPWPPWRAASGSQRRARCQMTYTFQSRSAPTARARSAPRRATAAPPASRARCLRVLALVLARLLAAHPIHRLLRGLVGRGRVRDGKFAALHWRRRRWRRLIRRAHRL